MSELKEVFNQIAPSWYNYRHYTIFPRELAELAGRWQRGKLLNIGCGHGADFLPFKDNFELYGMDFSEEMLRLAEKYAQKFNFKVELKQADARSLPYPDNTFDWAIAVATYHHIKGRDDQLQALGELRRVLKPGGEAFITVWNRYQTKFWFKGKEVMVPWKMKDKTLYRHYYLFTRRELEGVVRGAGLTVVRSFAEYSYKCPVKMFSRNICLVVRKENPNI